MNLNRLLTKQIDNSALIIFRIFFGFLMFAESVGAVALGWVKETFVEPEFTFNFIGFEWLQVFVGPQMYIIYALMAICGICIMLGYRYRLAIISFTLLWGMTYLAQKSHYNNHYYLVWLIAMLLCVMPANQYASLDVKQGRVKQSLTCPNWVPLVFIVQIFIVYTFASIAKFYPDWVQAKPLEIWFNYKTFQTPFWSDGFASTLKHFFSQHQVHLFFAYAGIFFDLLVVPFFLWNRFTRTFALIASLCFHLTNSAIFQIGVFPYFALSFVVFFYSPNFIRKLFFKRKPAYQPTTTEYAKQPNLILTWGLGLFLVIQALLPLRHHLIKGKVLWTEEGHRLSWRMMLRTKSAITSFIVEDKQTGKRENIRPLNYITKNQYGDLITKPDLQWQFAQRLKQEYAKQGKDVAVYVNSKVGVNGRPPSQLTIDTIDIANKKWKTFGHQDWLLNAPF